MNLETALYLIDVIDSFDIFFKVILIFVFIASLVLIGAAMDFYNREQKDVYKEMIKYLKISIFAQIFLSMMICLTPNQKTMYMILGIRSGKEIANSEIGQKVYKILNDKLDTFLKERK